jgi:hypothetical protein
MRTEGGVDPDIGERYQGYHSARCFEDRVVIAAGS